MKKLDFNQAWTFYKEGSDRRAILDLPHDAMIHEIRDPESEGGSALAFFPGGIYVYEKTFFAPASWKDMTVVLAFEGVYKNSRVYINGQAAGGRPYGYSQFYIHADEFLDYGKDNTIRVTADNCHLPNSRWYTGGGIYRPVYMLTADKTHIVPDGVKISTLSYAPARILVETTHVGGQAVVEIIYHGEVVAAGSGDHVEFAVKNAGLWSAETPNLYQCRVTLTEEGRVLDEVTTDFGIRLIEWSAKGLFINGVNTLLRGGCVHHDNGILGACTYDKAEERRIRIMKEAGFNAVRSSHNPASRAMLDACDKYGMYLIDETFDMWYMHKNKYDYATDFNDWYLEDMKSMIDRDFNHPSVIMYSIGNEVSEPMEEKGVEIARKMVDYIHSLDMNRAVTGGINLMIIHLASKGKGIYKDVDTKEQKPGKKPAKKKASGSLFFNMIVSMVGTRMNKMANSKAADKVTSPVLDLLDIAGYNYASGRYAKEGEKHPDRVVFGSETFPQDIAANWEMVKKYPYLIGDFMWTSWDYLGEAGSGAWSYGGYEGGFQKPYPWILAGSGAIDILGGIDAEAKYASTVWGLEDKPYIGVRPVNHPGVRVSKSVWRATNARNSWAWKNCEGNRAQIEVYSDAQAVELFVNGKSIGKRKIKNYKAAFNTKYAPGIIKAVSFDQKGSILAVSELSSATGETIIRITAEERSVPKGEIAYVNIDLVGTNGVIENNDDRKLTVTVDNGRLLAFGSANPRTAERYDSGTFTTYYGSSLTVIQGTMAGVITVRVSGDGLKTVTAAINVSE